MKKIILALVAAVTLVACAQKEKNTFNYTIECSRANIDGEVTLVIDTTKSVATVENGVVRFEGNVDEPRFGYLIDADREAFAQFVVEPGKIIIDDEGVHGTHSNDVIVSMSKRLSGLVDRFYAATTEEEKVAISEQFQPVIDSTFNANKDNFACIAILNTMIAEMDPTEIMNYINRMSPEMQNHFYMRQLKEMLGVRIAVGLGNQYLDFEAPLIDSKGGVAVSSLLAEGKYVLIDFWASWCGPCMGEVPYLQKAYERFGGDKFEILGFSLDENPEDWKSAAASMPWLHVSDGLGWSSPIANLYNVRSIPSNFLIAPDGIIVEMNLRGAALEEAIAKYVK